MKMKIPLATFLVTILSGCTILEPYKWPSGSREIILTFDDGPSRKVSKELLDVLKKHEVKATFCLIGKNIEKDPDVAKRIVAENHDLAMHTFNHTTATLLSAKRLARENSAWIELVEKEGIIDPQDIVLFRPPFGIITPSVLKVVKEGKFELAYLTFYVNDAEAEGDTAARVMMKIKERLLKHNGGAIVLHEMRFRHEGNNSQIDKSWLPAAVEDLIIWAKENRFRFSKYKS